MNESIKQYNIKHIFEIEGSTEFVPNLSFVERNHLEKFRKTGKKLLKQCLQKKFFFTGESLSYEYSITKLTSN